MGRQQHGWLRNSQLRQGRLVSRRFLADVVFASERDVRSFAHRFPLVLIAIFAALGIAVDTAWFVSFEANTLGWLALSTTTVLVACTVHWFHRTKQYSKLAFTGTTAVIVAAGFGYLHARSEHHYQSASVLELIDRGETPVVVQGAIKKTVVLRPNPLSFSQRREEVSRWKSQIELELHSIRDGDVFRSIAGNVLVYVDGDWSERHPGDELEIYGWLHPFDKPTNPGQHDLRDSFRRRGLHGRIETKDSNAITLIGETDGLIQPLIADIARGGRESLLRHTDETTGGLAVAMVIGQREFVDLPTRDALLATGTAHLLSVSGMHLAIIVLVITWLVSGFGLQPLSRFVVIVAISSIYVAVTGGRPPVFRAAILISIVLFSTCLHRPSQPLNTLGLAALVLMAMNPLNVFSVGVHLSFLAVITLMLAGRSLSNLSVATELQLERESGFDTLVEKSSNHVMVHVKSVAGFFGQMSWLSLCVTAVSLPLVWSQFHLISLISVVTNVMVWIGLMLALPAGVLTVLLDPVSSSLAAIPGVICHSSLAYMWSVIQWTESWSAGHAWLPAPPPVAVWIFYGVLAASLIGNSTRTKWLRRGWVVVWTLSTIFLATQPAALPENTLEATFVDVGHGTSVILRMPDEQVWLYDCGRMGNDISSSQLIDTALWSMGITHLDGIFLSHADADHYNALPGLLKRFSVDQLITPPGMLATDEASIDDLRRTIESYEIPVLELAASQDSVLRDMAVLHPPVGGVSGKHPRRSKNANGDNANSLVLQIDHAGRTLLLPGDLEPPGTGVLTATLRPTAGGIMMAPHHGSLSMDADAVLAWARPAETVVSGGDRAARLEVEEMLSVTGSGVSVTARQGAIRARIDRSGNIEIRSWLESPWAITR